MKRPVVSFIAGLALGFVIGAVTAQKGCPPVPAPADQTPPPVTAPASTGAAK